MTKITLIQVESIAGSNVVDKQLQYILKPFNVIQAFLFSNKYKIRDNVISANSFRECFVTLFGVLFATSSYVYALTRSATLTRTITLDFVISVSYLTTAAIDSIGCWLNYCTNVKNRQNNVLLVLKLQRASKFSSIECRKHVVVNSTVIAVLISFYILFVFLFWYYLRGFQVVDIINTYFFITFDLNVIYAARLLNLLSCHLEIWIKEVSRTEFDENLNSEVYWSRIYDSFMNVFGAYQLIGKSFKCFVSIL